MFFLFSGEGSTDIGTFVIPGVINTDENFHHGPLVIVVDQIVEQKYKYSIIDTKAIAFVPKKMLSLTAKKLSPVPKHMLPGDKKEQETGFYFKNARALSRIASKYETEISDNVVGILFRDTDKLNARGNKDAKYQSMVNGFIVEKFSRGVPMLAKPVSEAWMLCGLYKRRDSQCNCDDLENETYGSGSQHQLKDKLEEELKETPDRETLCEKVRTREINFDLVDLSSYKKFKARLEEVI
jgi:hypothetical protein